MSKSTYRPYIKRKKNPQVNNMNKLANKVNEILPHAYSAVVIQLYREGKTDDEIAEFLSNIDKIWDEIIEQDITMTDYCEKITGIRLMKE